MKYKEDKDLDFLQFCSHEDLRQLSDVMTMKDGRRRALEKLTSEESFKQNEGDLTKAWKAIAAYLQYCGSDDIVTMFRGGEGVLYDKVIRDVGNRLKADLKSADDILEMESRILAKVIEQAIEKMTDNERAAFMKELQENGARGRIEPGKLAPAAMAAAMQILIRQGGFASYKIAVVAANAVVKAATGKGLQFAANAAVTRWLAAFAGPAGWIATALMTIPMFTGPAYSITTPAVIHIAYLRIKLSNEPLL